ncbi:MAG: AAA family ATPase [Anaerolineae bacterium]
MIARDLPTQPTSFIGRTQELAEIVALLDNPDCHLLTLVGPGGIGKTRLALEIASIMDQRQANADTETETDADTLSAYSQGVYFVPLQPLNSPEFMLTALAEAMGLQFYAGGDPRDQLYDYLCSKDLLLILDNFEHLLEGVDLVTDLLINAPQLKLLVTSRETLNLQEEWLYQVKGMRYPEHEDTAVSDAEAYSAVRLFMQNARRVRPDFSLSAEQRAVLRICKLVEGMPLALEITAAWLRRLPTEEIVRQIEYGLDILENPVRNVPARHRSIRAVFEHSWLLLDGAECSVFPKLAVFRGGFRREAAERVAGATLGILSALVDKSLLYVDASGRYDLHELLRQFAEEKLSESPSDHRQAREDHCDYYVEFLSRAYHGMKVHDSRTLDEINIELKNLRSAWHWALEHRQMAERTDEYMCLALFYQFRCLFQEGYEFSAKTVEALRRVPVSEALGSSLMMQAWFVELGSQQHNRSRVLYEEALAAAEHTGDIFLVTAIYMRLSEVEVQLGNYERARELVQRCIELTKSANSALALHVSAGTVGLCGISARQSLKQNYGWRKPSA